MTPRSHVDGFVVVVMSGPTESPDESMLSEAARLLRLNSVEVARMLNAGGPFPVTRALPLDEAEELREKLRSLGIGSTRISESDLRLDQRSKRVRALSFTEDSLSADTGKSGQLTASWTDITLIVRGRLFSQRTEIEENRRGRRRKLVEKRELSSDESVLDIYLGADLVNWRILADNFDFSCLGSGKRKTAFENFAALIDLFKARVPAVRFDDAYLRNRQLVTAVWPLEERVSKDHGRRTGAHKFDVATITTTDNEAQFTRYSRLRHYLLCQEVASK